MAYSGDYFALQVDFVRKITAVSDISFHDALREYTSFYKTFRIAGWDFDHRNPVWQEFLRLADRSEDVARTAHAFYLDCIGRNAQNEHTEFGCFSYEQEAEDGKPYIQIHFRNADAADPGALSKERMPERMRELKAMFLEIREKHPDAKTVSGFSWLYNLEAYCRLFPPSYVRTRKTVPAWFRSTALGGQFLDSAGNLRYDTAKRFSQRTAGKKTLGQLISCFPYPLWELESDIADFYQWYGIV